MFYGPKLQIGLRTKCKLFGLYSIYPTIIEIIRIPLFLDTPKIRKLHFSNFGGENIGNISPYGTLVHVKHNRFSYVKIDDKRHRKNIKKKII